jgi:hypothetical protein
MCDTSQSVEAEVDYIVAKVYNNRCYGSQLNGTRLCLLAVKRLLALMIIGEQR